MENFFNILFTMAKRAQKNDEVPVAALIVDNTTGSIIAKAANKCEQQKDPLAHAEMLVIQNACKKLASLRLTNCDIYVTLEPCPMCASAISFARLRRLYFSAYDKKSGGVEHGPKIFNSPSCHHIPEVYGGIREKEGIKLMQDFFKEKRI